ncbi:MAG: ACT domain-containing protein [Synergistaceae bacterium]|jgi:aspartate kinase|nr:ACT domain-containing protein [Synergistaceae bacterium]
MKVDYSSARIVLLGVPDVPGVAAKVFSPLSEAGIRVDMIVQNSMRGGITDIGFLLPKNRMDDAIEICSRTALEVHAQGVSFNTETARVTVGADPAAVFSALAAASVNIEMIVSGPDSLTCVVAASSAERAAEALSGIEK